MITSLLLAALALQGVHQGEPPHQLAAENDWDCSEVITPTYFIHGDPSVLMYGKEIQFCFTLRESKTTDPKIDGLITSEAVSFWPTAATYLTGDLYAIAGKRNTNTVIEVWQVPMPSLEAFPAGGAPTEFAGGGLPIYKAAVYSDAVVGQDMVRLLMPNRGNPNAMFIQFYDSRDLYELDYTAAVPPGIDNPAYTLTKILSATANTGVPYVPELADSRLRSNHSNHHVSEGYVYAIFPSFEASKSAVAAGTTLVSLYLFDHDLDGVLDECGPLGETELQARFMWKAPDSYWIDRYHVTRMYP